MFLKIFRNEGRHTISANESGQILELLQKQAKLNEAQAELLKRHALQINSLQNDIVKLATIIDLVTNGQKEKIEELN